MIVRLYRQTTGFRHRVNEAAAPFADLVQNAGMLSVAVLARLKSDSGSRHVSRVAFTADGDGINLWTR